MCVCTHTHICLDTVAPRHQHRVTHTWYQVRHHEAMWVGTEVQSTLREYRDNLFNQCYNEMQYIDH